MESPLSRRASFPAHWHGGGRNFTFHLAAHPNGEIYFNESWESKNFAHRKRYKGDYNPDIKSYNPANGKLTQHTDYRGKDFWATISGNGNVYFVSDEGNDEYNLYTFSNGQKTALTTFDTSIKRPQVSANGEKVVFTKDYQIFLYDVNSKQTRQVKISLFKNNTLTKTRDFEVKGNITNFDVSPDNKKLAFVSRGELFVSDIKGKFVKQMSTAADERVLEVKWLKDSRTLLYNQTVNGYLNLFTIEADGKKPENQITTGDKNKVNLELDPEMEQAVYISGRDEIQLLNLVSLKSETVMQDEFWSLYAPSPHFSPDGKYLVTNAIRNFETDVFVYHLATKKTINMTNTGVTEGNPFWSPDGKYLFFESNLTKPSFPYGLQSSQIYRMALNKYEEGYKSSKFDELFVGKPESSQVKTKGKKGKEKEEISNPSFVSITEEGLMDRLTPISPNFGRQSNTFVTSKKEKTFVYYISNHDKGNFRLWKTTLQPFENNKTEKVSDLNIGNYQIAKNKDSHYLLMNGTIHSLNVSGNQTDPIKIGFKFRRNLKNEFRQIFFEAWAGFEENFYDGNFHGQNWQALRDQYSSYLPHVTNRGELRSLFNDMLGELNTSHFGFSSNGAEEQAYHGTRTNAGGIVFSEDDPYLVERIIKDSPADIKGKDIWSGDRLFAVNGLTVDPNENREKYFAAPSLDSELALTFSRNGNPVKVLLHPISSRAQRNLLYDEWVDQNQSYVDNKTSKRIAYVHMKNMAGGELANFKKEMVSEGYRRDALILDLRNNTGGNVHDEVLKFLSQKPYLQWQYRGGKLAPQPNFAPGAKPIVILINEQTLSDAEMTSSAFKQLGLGTIIGTETYRWIIFTSGKGLVDGSFYRLPSWGCYTLDGKNLEKEGVKPDIYVREGFTDRLTGNQPQLDKAIEEIMKQLGK